MQPVRERNPRHVAGREIEHEVFLFVNRRFDRECIEIKEDGHRGMGDALIAIDERVVHCKPEAQGAGLLHDRGIEVDVVERGSGLGKRRLEGTQVSDAVAATGGGQKSPVKADDFAEREIAHLREATIQLEILVEDARGRRLECRVRGRQQVGDRGSRKFLDGDAKTLGLVLQLGGLRRRQFDGDLHRTTVMRHPPANKRVKPAAVSTVASLGIDALRLMRGR